MRDKADNKNLNKMSDTRKQSEPSPLDLIKIHGGKSHKVRGMVARGADSMIAVYKNRFTYTFVMNKEVASIHYDQLRGKIFFSGHNIENLNLTEQQKSELYNVINVLESDGEGKSLKDAYQATLGNILADNI